MEARLLRAALVVAVAILSAGAGRPYVTVRSQHFMVSAPNQQLATEICQAAEQYRPPEQILSALTATGAQLVSLTPLRDTLEEFFVKKVRAETRSRELIEVGE